jgi:branched-chain amino acid transport system permease protein
MSIPILTSNLINVSILVALCIGFTFTYMMEKFPNFAHTSYASIGTMVSFYLVQFKGLNPYYTWPFSTILGGLLGVLLYVGIVKNIKIMGMRSITLTFTFYIISQMISSMIAMFSYWLLIERGIQSAGFMLRSYDFRIERVPGIGLLAPLTVILLVLLLNFFLYYSNFGIAMRATAENETLASNLGINVDRIHLATWFISGSLSGLAGAIIPMWLRTSINFSDTLLVSVMAGSVLGGLHSINGAIIGGLIIGTSKKWLTLFMMNLFGTWIGVYEELFPIIILFIILAIEPEGLMSLKIRNISIYSIRESLVKLRKALWNLLTTE